MEARGRVDRRALDKLDQKKVKRSGVQFPMLVTCRSDEQTSHSMRAQL